MADKQPYKFRIVKKDGTTLEGGAESRVLAIDHLRYCLIPPHGDDIAECWYLGKHPNAIPKRITRE